MKKLVVMMVICGAVLFAACGKKEAEAPAPAPVAEDADNVVAEETEAPEEDAEGETDEEVATEEGAEEEDADAAEENGDDDDWYGDSYPASFVEEQARKLEFDSFDEVIENLEPGQGYAYADVKGAKDKVLLISEDIFEGDDGTNANYSMSACTYYMNNKGKVVYGTICGTDSTGTPVAVSDDGEIFSAYHDEIETTCIGDNGTDNPGFMIMKSLMVSYSDDGATEEYSGFVRTNNDVTEEGDDCKFVEGDEAKAAFEKGFEEYEAATPIVFTVVE